METKNSNLDKISPSGEYESKGNYHKILDTNWKYYPVYVEKMRIVDRYLRDKNNLKIIDVGCGEGVMVKKYRALCYDIVGLDQNYQSPNITKGSILNIPIATDTFDLVTCLDVIEHLNLMDQPQAVNELHRILKPGGVLYASIPNLGHFASRLSFLIRGKLIRTSEVERHPGDRPFGEYKKMLGQKFTVEKTYGIFPTYPLISLLTYFVPSKVVWLHRLYNSLLSFKSFCFLNFFECRK